MNRFLAFSAVLCWAFAVMLLLAPAAFYEPTGVVVTPMLGTLAQAHGATLMGLGTVNWLGRRTPVAQATGLLAGNLVMQVLSLAVVLRTMWLGAGGKVAPGLAIHVGMAAAFLYFLLRARRIAPAAR